MSEETDTITTPPDLPKRRERTLVEEPMLTHPALPSTIDALLKNPGQVLYELGHDRGKKIPIYLLSIVTGAFLVFGFVLGLFSGGTQLWAAPLKVLLGAVVSGLITFPSLYVFSCLSGIEITFKKAAAALGMGLALTGLILLGLCPVGWIFSQSTESVGCMGFFALLFWIVGIAFGCSLVNRAIHTANRKGTGYLVLWTGIFVIVTLQMSTSLRPIIGPAGDTFLPTEKKFFLAHWMEGLDGD